MVGETYMPVLAGGRSCLYVSDVMTATIGKGLRVLIRTRRAKAGLKCLTLIAPWARASSSLRLKSRPSG